jgi:hypothetical protein
MSSVRALLLPILGAALVVLALGASAEPQSLAAAAGLLVAAAAAAAVVAVALQRLARPTGLAGRAVAHRGLRQPQPEPDHPDTAGRPRPRAPGILPAAA